MPDFPKPTKKIENFSTTPVAEIIDAYRGSIDLLRNTLAKEIDDHKLVEKADPHFGDDLYLARFIIMSYKKGYDKVKKYLRETMAWRKKNQDLLIKYRAGEAPTNDAAFRQFIAGGYHYRNKDGDLVSILRNGLGNPDAILAKMKPDAIQEYMTHSKEAVYAICDADTRSNLQTGKGGLVSLVTLLDFNHSVSSKNGSKFREATTDSGKEVDLYYPMLVGVSAFVNMPGFLTTVMKVAVFMMPKQQEEKMLICDEEKEADRFNFIVKSLKLDKKDIPTFLGGECECEGGCCLGTVNTHTKQLEEKDAPPAPTWAAYMARAAVRPVA